MIPSNLKVLATFGLCSDCSQKFDECSLARARTVFATARMLGSSLKFPVVPSPLVLGQHARTMKVSGKMLPRFVDVY